jgi:hypothetical protein
MSRHLYQGTFKDGNGRVVGTQTTANATSGTISIYLANGTTAANVYAAETGGSQINSVSTDDDGHFQFWIDDSEYMPSQRFKITLSHADFEDKSYDDIKIIPDEPYIYYVDASAADQGAATTRADRTIKDLVDSIGTSKSATLVLPHSGTGNTTTYTLSTAEVLTSNIHIKFEPGALLKPDLGIALTVASPEHIIASPRQQIFDTTNESDAVAFTVGGVVYVDWWENNATPGTTDMASAIQAAIDVCGEGTGIVKLNTGIYAVGTTLDINASDVMISGTGNKNNPKGATYNSGDGSTVIKWIGAVSSSIITINADEIDIVWGTYLRDLTIDGDDTTSIIGVDVVKEANRGTLDNVEIVNCATCFESNDVCWSWTFRDTSVFNFLQYGWDLKEDAHNFNFFNCRARNPDSAALQATPAFSTVRIGATAGSSNINFYGIDFESRHIQNGHLDIKQGRNISIFGGYMEVKDTDINAPILCGDTAQVQGLIIQGLYLNAHSNSNHFLKVETNGVIAAHVSGCTFRNLNTAVIKNTTAVSEDCVYEANDSEGTAIFNMTAGFDASGWDDNYPTLVNITDDSFVALVPPSTVGQIKVWADRQPPKGGACLFDSEGAAASTTSLYATANFTFTTGALNGTTGADGDLTISAHTDGLVYIENRLGAAHDIVYNFQHPLNDA